jgi:uncharacterized membrane protein (DUF373 family)
LAREISITIDQTESLNTMAILSTVIVVVAIGWVIAPLLITRRRLRNGGFSSVIMCHLTLYLLSPIEG